MQDKKNKMKKKKKRNGLTLIALIITVILMLMLLSVAINVSTNGKLFKYAGKAANDTEQLLLKDEVSEILVFRRKFNSNKTLKEDLEAQVQGEKTVINVAGCYDVCQVNRQNAVVTVYDDGVVVDGTVDIWDGEAEENPEFREFNWYIYTPAQLKFLADFVNNNNTLTADQRAMLISEGYNPDDVTLDSDTVVYLMKDLDLGARSLNGNWETAANEAKKWTPIGIAKDTTEFVGIFEGNNHTIRGVYVNQTEKYGGIFGNSNTIKNLTVKDSYIKGSTCTGGICRSIKKRHNRKLS